MKTELNRFIEETMKQANAETIKFTATVTMVGTTLYLKDDKARIEFKRTKK